MSKLDYKKEIDGLRAIAVTAVVLFHSGLNLALGGYIGVDIFFVISGYLITAIIQHKFKNNTFSIVKFYEKRVRRIFPALFFMLVVTYPFAWNTLFPDDFKIYSQSLLSVITFTSNIFFWLKSDYFAPTAEYQMLIHTWSLGVEEQFYIFYPIVLWAINKYFRNKLAQFLIILSIVSFALTVVLVRYDQLANFYMMPSRVWELLAGGLAYYYSSHISNNKTTCQILSVTGLVLIFIAIFLFDKNTLNPYFPTLLPILGTVLVILFANKFTLTGRLLSSKPLVFIGLISYSTYLWHQPLFAVYNNYSIRPQYSNYGVQISLIVLSYFIGFISWKFVEQPFRNSNTVSFNKLLKLSITSSIVIVSLGCLGHFSKGLPFRINKEALSFMYYLDDNNPELGKCRDMAPENSCQYINDTTGDTIAVWGDSHADQITPMLREVAKNNSKNFIELSTAGCPPILNYPGSKKEVDVCEKGASQILEYITHDSNIKTVIIHAYWQYYLDDNPQSFSYEQRAAKIEDTFKTLNDAGKKIIIIHAVPKIDINPALTLAKAKWMNKGLDLVKINLNKHLDETAISRKLLTQASKMFSKDNLHHIYPHQNLCDESFCYANDHMVVYYRDDNHLSVTGSYKLKDYLDQALIMS